MKKPEDSDAFPKSNMAMTIQSQVLSMCALKSLLYMLQDDERKASIHQHVFPQQCTQNTAN